MDLIGLYLPGIAISLGANTGLSTFCDVRAYERASTRAPHPTNVDCCMTKQARASWVIKAHSIPAWKIKALPAIKKLSERVIYSTAATTKSRAGGSQPAQIWRRGRKGGEGTSDKNELGETPVFPATRKELFVGSRCRSGPTANPFLGQARVDRSVLPRLPVGEGSLLNSTAAAAAAAVQAARSRRWGSVGGHWIRCGPNHS